MASTTPVSLTEFINLLVAETADAVHTSVLRQLEEADDLTRLASLPVEEFAAQRISEEDATSFLRENLGVNGPAVKIDVPRIEKALGITLEIKRHLERLDGTIGVLNAEGFAFVTAGARAHLAEEQRNRIDYIVRRGMPRVMIDSGEIRAKVRLNVGRKPATRRRIRDKHELQNLVIDVETSSSSDGHDLAEVLLRLRTVV